MIEITRELEELHRNLFAKAKDCAVEHYSEDRFAVTPNDKSKSKRMVTFVLTGGRMKALCEDFNNGDECPANSFNNFCYHCAAAIQFVLHSSNPTLAQKRAAQHTINRRHHHDRN